MPTDVDLKLAEDLADFRVDAEKRFASVDRSFGDLRSDLAGIRSDLVWVKRIGGFVLALLLAAGAGTARVIWEASAVIVEVRQHGRALDELRADVRQQGSRLERVEGRLDRIEAKLDRLIEATGPRPGVSR